MEVYTIAPLTSTPACPFCDGDICDDCGGCHGDCPEFHLCGCCEIRDDRGRVVETIPSKRCLGCGDRAPIVFLSRDGICPDCRP